MIKSLPGFNAGMGYLSIQGAAHVNERWVF